MVKEISVVLFVFRGTVSAVFKLDSKKREPFYKQFLRL